MRYHPLTIALVWLGFFVGGTACHAQSATTAQRGLGARKPQDPIPGVIVRVYLNDRDPKKFPTHLVAVAQDGNDFKANFAKLATDELRGAVKNIEWNYIATGFIILEKDTELAFTMGDSDLSVGGKAFGRGTYTKAVKKGKYPIEVIREWGRGQGGFTITDPMGNPVLFYTGEMLNRELARYVKLEGRNTKTKLLGEPAPAAK